MMRQMKIIEGKLGGAMKVVIYGPEGIGKSTLAAQFPRPLFIDTEGSTRRMDVRRLEKPTSWTMLMEQVRFVKEERDLCSTLVIDTADWAEALCTANVCAEKHVGGIEDFGYGKGYVYLAEKFGALLNLLEEIVDRGVHVVLTAHAKMRKFEQPDEMGAYDRWELKLQQKTAALVKEWSDLLLFANYKTMAVAVDDKGKKFKAQGGRRVLYTTHHPCWDAKNRLGLPDELPLDYAALSRYFDIDAPRPAEPQVSPEPAPVVKPPEDAAPPVPAHETAESAAAEAAGPEVREEAPPPGGSGALGTLRDLMRVNGVSDYEVQAAVAARGYFPEQTPLENLPEDFIQGVLVGAWSQVHGWIKANHPLPF